MRSVTAHHLNCKKVVLLMGLDEDLKYIQIHDLDDSFNNSRVNCTYDFRLQIKQQYKIRRESSFVNGFR